MLSPPEILERSSEARKLSASCRLCPRQCGVNRPDRETGYCGAGPEPSIAAALPHWGEEPPLTSKGGAGTIFFSRCNLRCVFCQNHQISQGPADAGMIPRDLAEKMLDLQRNGCANLEPVSPSHHLPGFLEALSLAAARGLDLPLVYNTNGYETPQTLDLLDGIVDVYLPDLKYASNEHGARFSDADDYVETARTAVLQMYGQVGNLVVDLEGRAVQGMILRHLVLPEDLAGTRESLVWIRDNLPRTVTISLMAQYEPVHRSTEFSQLSRRIAAAEYDEALDLAWELGFENVFVQDLSSAEIGVPDFQCDQPFNWRNGEDSGKLP